MQLVDEVEVGSLRQAPPQPLVHAELVGVGVDHLGHPPQHLVDGQVVVPAHVPQHVHRRDAPAVDLLGHPLDRDAVEHLAGEALPGHLEVARDPALEVHGQSLPDPDQPRIRSPSGSHRHPSTSCASRRSPTISISNRPVEPASAAGT